MDLNRKGHIIALELLKAKLLRDKNILAAYIFGSLARGDFWDKSDIDMHIIVRDEDISCNLHTLIENNIIINVDMFSRAEFTRLIGRSLQNPVATIILAQAKFIICKDQTLYGLQEEAKKYCDRDIRLHILKNAVYVLGMTEKIEKYLVVYKDYKYSIVLMFKAVEALAKVVMSSNGVMNDIFVINDAIKYEEKLFHNVFSAFFEHIIDEKMIRNALNHIDEYLNRNMVFLFQPILSYLKEYGDAMGVSSISHYFYKQTQLDVHAISHLCRWLAVKGIVYETSVSKRLTPRSTFDLNEAAYFYTGE